MNFTPVPIRGKRKRHNPSNKPPNSLSHDVPHSKQPKMKHSLLTVVATRSSRRSTLESLPSEILESILLYSANVSLPRASHILGMKLSERATLLRLFIWGFHDTWNQWFGISIPDDEFVGPKQKDGYGDSSDGDPQFQSALLDLPWVNIDLILQAQQTWADTYARNRWYQHCVPSRSGKAVSFDCNHKGGFGHFNARECFEVDYQNFKTWQPYTSDELHWFYRDVSPLTCIPARLISGPWDDEKQRQLFWLIRGGVNIGLDGQPPLTWELRLECLRNAMIDAPEPNILISNLLLLRLETSWGCMGIPRDVARADLRRLQRRLEWGGDSGLARKALQITEFILETEASALGSFPDK